MRSYVRKSESIGKNTRIITHYTPGEYLFLSIIKLIFFIVILWPIQIIWFLLTIPFRLLGMLYRSSAPTIVKVIVTVIFAIIVFTFIIYIAGSGNGG